MKRQCFAAIFAADTSEEEFRVRIQKYGSIIVMTLVMGLTGCGAADAQDAEGISFVGQTQQDSAQVVSFYMEEEQDGETVEEQETEIFEDPIIQETKDIAELYRDLYEAEQAGSGEEDDDFVQDVMNRLGEAGYAVIDRENQNQRDMIHPEKLEAFCREVEGKLEGEVTFFSVMGDGGFIRFDLTTSGGEVSVNRSVLVWEDGQPQLGYQSSYPAKDWTYAEEGYLFFDEELPEGYDGASGYTAIRVEPLEEQCREYNRLYILPVGYAANNMFVTDWSEKDFAELDFYDLFDILYPYVYQRPIPYEKTVDGEKYLVPQQEFETVIRSCFSIDTKKLQANTKYLKKEKAYEYRTRGFYDSAASPNLPYPEVVAYEENEDGTILLTVNAVWPQKHLSKAFSHEVVVRPLENGKFQYVSNHVITEEGNGIFSWYEEKLSDEEWEKLKNPD